MPVTVLGLWEHDWMDAERTERRLWKQTIQAFAVDQWCMAPVRGGPFTSPIQYTSTEEMLASHPGPKTFLIPSTTLKGASSLKNYEHPENAIYVFGNVPDNLVRYVTDADDVVNIETPVGAALFAVAAMSMVLYDRHAKS